ncbi:hypothetical protein [Sansalvadorimonas verongulae]|uniref:hypothetical protein n=1 Tax=Sansalvadorimonas verongulae TaxID=2172824 RepID=UPI0012BD7E90|nr:hypothetical protein [Sansalvadorimonas verongulae]MTI13526.1 hypothetical protein [Sansalvadorimonas verongulae]
MRRRKTKAVLAFIAAAVTTFLLASINHTLFVLHELAELGIAISTSIRMQAISGDMAGLLPGYGAVISLGLLLAFTFLKFISKKLVNQPNPQWYWWGLAGGFTLFSALMLMQPLLNITLIAGARSDFGFAMQCLSGVCGGVIYGMLRPQTPIAGEKEL